MKIKLYFLVSLLLIGFSSCKKSNGFEIKGEISDAADKMLYLDEMGINGTIGLDSVKLGSSGTYEFNGNRPESPEFYRLRLGDEIINFAIDSTETITINSNVKNFSTDYTVEGSENNTKIKELVMLQIALQNSVNKLAQNSSIPAGIVQDSIIKMVDGYKTNVTRKYIFAQPNMTYAYFALFQKLNNYMIFDPLANKDDLKCFAAVATSLNNVYPHADRSRNLYNMVIKGMKNTRAVKEEQLEVSPDKIKQANIIDIDLMDVKGRSRKLTDLKGKVVILDFTIYNHSMSAAHNLALRELYSKYSAQGLEIYQVSLDEDEHFWKTASDNLPWICVRDANGTYSNYLALYNVTNIPTFFIINKANELRGRSENIAELEGEVKKLL